MSRLIVVENKSTVVSDQDLADYVEAQNMQFAEDFNTSGWVRRGLAPEVTVSVLPAGSKPPVGAWNLILLDNTDQQGALGYHDDEQGTKIPYSEVFAVTCQQDNVAWQSCASHEALEMTCDPFVDPGPVKVVERADTGDKYIVEVCDPVQDKSYLKTVSSGAQIAVSDFCFWSWWGKSSWRPCSFLGSVTHPFELTSGGYISYEDAAGNWKQVFGDGRTAHPAWASRLPRIHPDGMVRD